VVKIAEDITGMVRPSRLRGAPRRILLASSDGSDHLQREVIVEHKGARTLVAAEQFDALGWVMPVLGARAVVTPGSTLRGHLTAAIKHLSSPTKRTIYAHYGWRRIGDKWFYLHSDGAIGADGPVEGIEVRGRCQPVGL
jgi:hypothetical protein